jgi:hypothetical protein
MSRQGGPGLQLSVGTPAPLNSRRALCELVTCAEHTEAQNRIKEISLKFMLVANPPLSVYINHESAISPTDCLSSDYNGIVQAVFAV